MSRLDELRAVFAGLPVGRCAVCQQDKPVQVRSETDARLLCFDCALLIYAGMPSLLLIDKSR